MKKIWNRLKSEDFKNMILNNYDFEKLTENQLKKLILIHRDFFNLKIKI